jgi:AMP deaminase
MLCIVTSGVIVKISLFYSNTAKYLLLSSMDSSSPTSSLHLAMAALVGASLIAISAFYIHKRSVDQVLQRLIEIRRKPSRNAGNRFVIEYDDEADEEAEAEEERDNDGGYGSDGEMAVDREMWGRSLSRSLDENVLRS